MVRCEMIVRSLPRFPRTTAVLVPLATSATVCPLAPSARVKTMFRIVPFLRNGEKPNNFLRNQTHTPSCSSLLIRLFVVVIYTDSLPIFVYFSCPNAQSAPLLIVITNCGFFVLILLMLMNLSHVKNAKLKYLLAELLN